MARRPGATTYMVSIRSVMAPLFPVALGVQKYYT